MAGRILIADNVATNRIILKVKLSRARYETFQASSKDDAVTCARALSPDVILIDHALPGGGLETLRLLKSDAATRHIPVVVLDGTGSRERRIEMLRAGAEDCLTKPLDEAALLALVRNLMRAHAGRLELVRRQDTMTDLGVGPAAQQNFPSPRVSVIASTREIGLRWRRDLGLRVDGQIESRTKTEILDIVHQSDTPDAFVLSADLETKNEGLRLVSELRSHPATRRAVIILLNETISSDTSVWALDVGTDAVVQGPFDADEVAARLARLVARKQEMDHLRSSYKEQLDLAMIDPLTGVFNRRYADAYLARVAADAAQLGQPFALMLLDLDRFKNVNDTYGHLVGDQVLRETARRLRNNLRETDLVARFGGEEFLIAMPGASVAEARLTAQRLHDVIANAPVATEGHAGGIPVTISIGVAYHPAGDRTEISVHNLMEEADHALYASKAEGRNQITFANHEAA